MARSGNKEESKRRILSACVKLFIEKGFHNTTMAEILRESGTTSSTFQNIFRTKDGVILELTEFMFDNQFASARNVSDSLPLVYIYAVETCIQMTLVELNENLRDIYVETYSNGRTMEYVFERTSVDFYEMEIGTAGIMRNYMKKKCDLYFTLEKKIARFLDMSLNVYNVPKDEREKIIAFVLSIDIRKEANQIMQKLFKLILNLGTIK